MSIHDLRSNLDAYTEALVKSGAENMGPKDARDTLEERINPIVECFSHLVWMCGGEGDDFRKAALGLMSDALDDAFGQQIAHPDDRAVDRFAAAMKVKLAQKRSQGRGGWENKDECSAEFLSRLLRQHVEKGDPVDVGNLAMMLQQRGESISSTGAVAQLHAIVDAWEALPGGRRVRNRDVEEWLAEDMAPAINAVRGFLRRTRPDGILPPPPTPSTQPASTALVESEKLKPCPFCGSPAELEQDGRWFNLGCSHHWGRVNTVKNACVGGRIFYAVETENKARAIEGWSRRATLSASQSSSREEGSDA